MTNLVIVHPVPAYGYNQCVRCGDQWHKDYKYGCMNILGVGMVCFDCREKEGDTDEG